MLSRLQPNEIRKSTRTVRGRCFFGVGARTDMSRVKPALVAVAAVSVCGGFDRLHPTKAIPLAQSIVCDDTASLEQNLTTTGSGSNQKRCRVRENVAKHKLADTKPKITNWW